MPLSYHMAVVSRLRTNLDDGRTLVNKPTDANGREACFAIVWHDLLASDEESAIASANALFPKIAKRTDDQDILAFIAKRDDDSWEWMYGVRVYPQVPYRPFRDFDANPDVLIACEHVRVHVNEWATETDASGAMFATSMPTYI